MKKVLWLSRHQMTEPQKKALEDMFGSVTIVHSNMVWASSKNWEQDFDENTEIWKSLMEWTPIIAGVFPPVAIEAVPWDDPDLQVYSPVSVQTGANRRDPETKIPHRFGRWARIK